MHSNRRQHILSKTAEMLQNEHEEREEGEAREMLCNALLSISRNAQILHQLVESGKEMPEWSHFKIAQAQQAVSAVADFAQSDLGDDEEQEMTEDGQAVHV